MPTDRINDLKAFKGFIEQRLVENGDEPTLGEALAQWEVANQSDEALAETLDAIREGLADVEAGHVTPARQALDELRRKHSLPPLP